MKAYVRSVALLVLLQCVPAYCETYTMETYYPSPAGVYNNLTVTSGTVLSRDGGETAVGSAARPANLKVTGVVVPGRMQADPVAPESRIEGAIYFNTAIQAHKVYRSSQWVPLGGGFEIIGADEGAGKTGTQACLERGLRCVRVFSYNSVGLLGRFGCPMDCSTLCSSYYNQSLPGVVNGKGDNSHSCDAKLGRYKTFYSPGPPTVGGEPEYPSASELRNHPDRYADVECEASFSVFCSS